MERSLRQLWFILLLNLVVAGALANLTDVRNHGFAETTLTHTWRTLKGDFWVDSWEPMQQAWDHWKDDPGPRKLYSHILVGHKIRFQYPPITLVLPRWLSGSGVDPARFYAGMTYLFLLITVFAVAAIARHSLMTVGEELSSRRPLALLLVLVAGLTLTYYPVLHAATMGQIQVWLTALSALSLLAYLKDRRVLAGVLLGVVASVKPQYGLFLVWGIVRRERMWVLGFLATAGLIAGVGVMAFGLSTSLDYFEGLRFLSLHGESYYPNNSINGIISRLVGVDHPELYNNTTYTPGRFPPYNPWVYFTTIAAGLVIVAAALRNRPGQDGASRAVDYCLMTLGLTMASPIAWTYHYGVLLPIFAFLWPLLWLGNVRPPKAGMRWLLAGSFLVSANFVAAANLLAPTFWNVFQSYLFLAAVVVFLLLLGLGRQSEVARRSRSSAAAEAGR